jgi:hypothetical protein
VVGWCAKISTFCQFRGSGLQLVFSPSFEASRKQIYTFGKEKDMHIWYSLTTYLPWRLANAH